MRRLLTLTGRLIEVRRHIAVPSRWCEQYPTRERWELWVRTNEGRQRKITAHTRLMPARRGQRVALLMSSDQPVAMLNLSTGDAINFYKTEPPLIWTRCEGARLVILVVALMLWAMASGQAEWLLGLPCVTAVALIALFGRWIHRAWEAARVARTLRAITQGTAKKHRT